ncbi:hypothetical protein LDG_6391 [Legionella drancourtii LLAP12]|uniref:Uncharacterized protein n=1 Tax=Legionella drancourtii LLAP12 TaxID=658187 RepID=G9EMC5_9GAMM|nr:hypothetical protein LDG_6391 [Legionella drancourtii LLAP12]
MAYQLSNKVVLEDNTLIAIAPYVNKIEDGSGFRVYGEPKKY